MFWKLFVLGICITTANTWDKSFAIKQCAMITPHFQTPNILSGIKYAEVKIPFGERDIASKIYHIIPAKKLREFFTYAIRDYDYRLKFVHFLMDLYKFTRNRYQENTPFNLVNHHLVEVGNMTMGLIMWAALSDDMKAKTMDAFDTRFVRAMFTMMPFNLVIGPKKRCDKLFSVFDDELKFMVEHFDKLRRLNQKMKGESTDFQVTINLLFDLLGRNKRMQPYGYDESKWEFNKENKCYAAKQTNLSTRINGNSIIETKDPMCLISMANLFTAMDGQMGIEIERTQWPTLVFPFNIDGRTFFYGHNSETRYYSIQEILPGGTRGKITSNGYYVDNNYDLSFPFTIAGSVFFYSQSKESNNWCIKGLHPNGQINGHPADGHWTYSFDVVFPFTIDNGTYFYGRSEDADYWCIYELLPGGKMGKMTSSGNGHPKGNSVPFSIGRKTYFYTQQTTNCWRITELLPNGQIGNSTQGSVDTIYEVNFPIYFEDRTFLYRHDLETKRWFIIELMPGAVIGSVISKGVWNKSYNVSFPFTVDGKTFFYGLNVDEKEWIIREII